MLTKKIILRAAGGQPHYSRFTDGTAALGANIFESKQIQELKREIAELKQAVNSLKNRPGPCVVPGGKQRQKSFTTEKLTLRNPFRLRNPPRTNGNYPRPSPRSNSTAMFGSVTNITAARPKTQVRWRRPVRASQGQTIGRSASANVIVFALGCAEHLWMIGSSGSIGDERQCADQQT